MTPRALLTAIGATAIGFAIAIGSVAGFTSEAPAAVSATNGNDSAITTMAFIDASTGTMSRMGAETFLRTPTGEIDCPISL